MILTHKVYRDKLQEKKGFILINLLRSKGVLSMDEMKKGFELHQAEYRFMEVIWANEPVNSTALVKLCEDQLGWKKSTTYTVLRKLCQRGFRVFLY